MTDQSNGRTSTGAGKSWGLGCEVELCLFETAARDGCSDLKNPMSADRCPTHLPLLVHTGIDEAARLYALITGVEGTNIYYDQH